MFNWKMILMMILPSIEMAGHAYKAQDENDSGKDDAIGETLVYVSKLLKALLMGKDPEELPKAPDFLK